MLKEKSIGRAMVESSAVLAVIRTARPAFRNKHDKVAFAIHALFVTSGYRLIAAGAAAEADTSGECSWSICQGWGGGRDEIPA